VNLILDRGAHACHFFTSFNDQKQVTLPFCSKALKNNEYVLLAFPEQSIDDWYLELQAFGVNVQDARDRGALAIKGVRPPPSQFNAVAQSGELWRVVAPQLNKYEGVGLVREVPWQPDLALPVEKLCHFECAKGLLFANSNVRSICQYDLMNHSPEAIHTALRTHQTVVLDGKMHTNPFYEAPRILAEEPWAFSSKADRLDVDKMLAWFS
jgi:hypothetical protein